MLTDNLTGECEEIGHTVGHEYAREGLLEHLKALKDCYMCSNELFSLRDERGLTILHIAVLMGKAISPC